MANRLHLTSLLTCALLASTLANKCQQDCTQFKLELPPEPSTGFNTGEAVSKLLDGIFTFMRAKNFGEWIPNIGYMAGGLFAGIWGAAHSTDDSEYQRYQLQKSFKQQSDYLACVMEAQVSNAVYQMGQRMDQDKIDAFNNAISSVVSYISDNCAQHNCLNVTNVEPSVRNAATGRRDASCVTGYPPLVAAGPDCNNTVWNPKAPILCVGYDTSGGKYDGVCGIDGLCYHSDVGFDGTIKAFQALKAQFLSKPGIDSFNAFDNLLNPNAVVAYAKGALVYLSVLQELYFLGSASAEEGTMRMFAARAADWLQNRVDYHTNYNISLLTVMDASKIDGEPVSIRYSCQSSDLFEQWWGCSFLSGMSYNTQVCLLPPASSGNADKLCACDCSDDGKRNACHIVGNVYQQTTVNQTLPAAARNLCDRNMQLFNSSGVLSTIQTLRSMSQLNPFMPPDSFKWYQTLYTPNFTCSMNNASQIPALRAGREANTVAPLGTWEEPQNLRAGSVVLRGTVIGGERMLALVGGQVAAPPKAPNAQPPKAPNAQPPKAPNTQPPKAPNAQPPKAPNTQPPKAPAPKASAP